MQRRLAATASESTMYEMSYLTPWMKANLGGRQIAEPAISQLSTRPSWQNGGQFSQSEVACYRNSRVESEQSAPPFQLSRQMIGILGSRMGEQNLSPPYVDVIKHCDFLDGFLRTDGLGQGSLLHLDPTD